jgi:peptidoglycan DL-endopeptidase CwlO
MNGCVPLSDVVHPKRPIDTYSISRRRARVLTRLRGRAIRATLALVIAASAGFAGSIEDSAAAGRGPGSAHHAASRAGAHHGAARAGRAHHHGRSTRKPPRRAGVIAVQPPPSAVGTKGEIALKFALAQIGKPYVYGGAGPDTYDCSGLAQRAWRAAGIRIPRTTQQQAGFGTPVPVSQMRAGDLVIFYSDASHVGVYAGNGKVVVAPHQGAYVTVQPVKWMPIYNVRRPG